MLSHAERLGIDLGKVWESFGQGKRELKGLIGKMRKERMKKERRKEGLRTRQGFGELEIKNSKS